MADRKISELTNITGANLADDDEFALVDTSADETKAITFGEFKTALDTATGFVRITGDTMTGNLSMGDNVKAIFGASSDLQIYHDGNNSYISDQGTGNLKLLAENFVLKTPDDSTNAIFADTDASVYLYHAGSQKLQTTSTGIDVTGTVTADGLTVDGTVLVDTTSNTVPLVFARNQSTTESLRVGVDDNYAIFLSTQDENYGRFVFQNNNGTTTKNVLAIEPDGDLSLYEDTGTTAKLTWSASAEGLTLSGNDLDLSAGTGAPQISITTGSGDAGIELNAGNSQPWYIYNEVNDFHIRSDDTDYLTIDTSGNVGIGTSSPSYLLHTLLGAGESNGVGFLNTNGQGLNFYTDTTASNADVFIDQGASGASLAFKQAGTERMRLDASGNLLVGKTSSGLNSAGIEIRGSDDALRVTRSGGNPVYLNRQTSDGSIIDFAKDGTTVGSIDTHGGVIQFGQGNVNLAFENGADVIYPANDSGTNNDGDIDLGTSSARFKDLYLSGGVYLGGTGSANKLDDYEEGTWTPRLVGSSSESGQSYSVQSGDYTKIGNQVICRFGLTMSAAGSFSGFVMLDGLPFSIENNPPTVHLGNLYFVSVGQNIISVGLQGYENDNKAYLWIKTSASASREYPSSSGFITNTTHLTGSFTFQTTS